jgi:hypothetical protein
MNAAPCSRRFCCARDAPISTVEYRYVVPRRRLQVVTTSHRPCSGQSHRRDRSTTARFGDAAERLELQFVTMIEGDSSSNGRLNLDATRIAAPYDIAPTRLAQKRVCTFSRKYNMPDSFVAEVCA